MSLLSDIEASIVKTGPRCGVALTLEQLNAADGADLQAALDNKARYKATTISAVLKSKDIHLSDSTINRHRRGACECRSLTS